MMKKTLAILCSLLVLAGCKHGISEGMGAGAHGYVNVTPGTQADLEVNVGDRVFFAYDSSVVDHEAQGTLDRQAEWMAKYPNVNVTVEGHADERGTREYNLALGERRAHAAMKYLASKGVSKDRMKTVSYGKERPAVMGSGEEVFSQNRRAVTVVAN